MIIPSAWKGSQSKNSGASLVCSLRGELFIHSHSWTLNTDVSLNTTASSACEETTVTTQQGSNFEMWFPVLKVAHMWQCDAIHKLAIKNMPYNQIDKTLGEKLKLAIQYDMPPWILSGVNVLAQRKEPLGMDDFACFGPELTLKVAAVRESLGISSDRGGFYRDAATLIAVNGTRDASTVDFTPAIKGVFQLSG